MEELLEALRKDDLMAINELAKQLLLMKDGKTINKLQANEFEHFARCRIEQWPDATIFKGQCYKGTITFRNKVYGFG
jgi:hypothetical protein